MRVLEGVEENFRFMVLEVTKQVENTLRVIENPDPGLVAKIESRDDYIDNLKSVIENKCFSRIHTGFGGDKRAIDMARAVNIVTSNLERLADHAVNIVMQSQYLRDPHFIKRYDYKPFFTEIIKALRLVVKALYNQDITLAFKICRAEITLDALFKSTFQLILADLRRGESPENCITAHNIFRYLERMGDTILNIGEAIIFAAVGEKFKIHQYEALKETLAELGQDVPISDGEFQSIWGTRSGCRIGAMRPDPKGRRSAGVLFKEGNSGKLRSEVENIRRWESVMRGLPPKVQAFHEDGDSASVLMEYLGGCTFQEVVLTASPEIASNATFILEQTVRQLWADTRRDTPVRAGSMQQLSQRMEDVLRMHPSFNYPAMHLVGIDIPSFEDLLGQALALEEGLEAPFSVFIHGDFNTNNIVYNHEEQRIHYIDVHRSRQSDYVQDVSVFLISNFRMPVLDRLLRRRLDRVMSEFLAFSREFARECADAVFEARLALGLARSLITSSRFEFKQRFAREMFDRGVFLMRGLAAHARAGKPWPAYALPEAVLIY